MYIHIYISQNKQTNRNPRSFPHGEVPLFPGVITVRTAEGVTGLRWGGEAAVSAGPLPCQSGACPGDGSPGLRQHAGLGSGFPCSKE